MAVCLYVNVEEFKTEERLAEGLSLLKTSQPRRVEQIGRMKKRSDQARSLGAGLLLQYMSVKYLKEEDFRAMVNSTATQSGKLGEVEDSPFPPAEFLTVEEISATDLLKKVADTKTEAKRLTFGKTEAGSPFAEGLNAFVSLSHTGALAICAMAGRPCGVDIECTDQEADRLREHLASRYFFQKEKQLLEEASDFPEKWQRNFCQLWCYKEAYGKMKGTGLRDGLLFNFYGETKEKVSFYDIHTDFGYVGELCLLEGD